MSTASALALRAMLAYAGTRGVDVPALLGELGVSRATLDDPDARLPLALHQRAWELASARSRDPVFGLHVAEHAGLGAFEALDYAFWSSTTYGDAVDRLSRFHRLIGDDLSLRVDRRGSRARLVRDDGYDQPQREDCFLAIATLRSRELLTRPFPLREVHLGHRAPSNVRPYAALFRCPVRFGAKIAQLVIDADVLEAPVRCAKPGLAAVLDRYMRDLISRLPRDHAFPHRVRHAIARSLHGGRPSVGATARLVHASPRTVQRRLRELGVSHRAVVEEVRREMAERLLAERRLSIGEVAYLLGFEDASGFRRAYRRWTGRSPSRGRR